jgi:hypothetical protein
MTFALATSFVSVAPQSPVGYNGTLVIALLFALSAVACFTAPFRGGSVSWRIIAVALSLPAIFVLLDFADRFLR